MPEKTQRFSINGNTLKMIAIITMLIDHIGAVLVEVGMLGVLDEEHFISLLSTPSGGTWYLVDLVLRIIGRIAFPIFCFLLVEGFFHTRDRKKYALRLLIFALASELPFDLAVRNQPIYLGAQNVFFTLFLGVVTMGALELSKNSKLQSALSIIAGCLAAVVLNTDYNAFGIVMIIVFYLFHGNRRKTIRWGAIAAALESMGMFCTAALAMIPISMYNGERGKIKMKYFFYLFYPMHLLVLYAVRILWIKPL